MVDDFQLGLLVSRNVGVDYKEKLEFVQRLGEGMQGIVDLYRDPISNMNFAIKVSQVRYEEDPYLDNAWIECQTSKLLTETYENQGKIKERFFAYQYEFFMCEMEMDISTYDDMYGEYRTKRKMIKVVISYMEYIPSIPFIDWMKKKRSSSEWKRALLEIANGAKMLELFKITDLDMNSQNVIYSEEMDRFFIIDFGVIFSQEHSFPMTLFPDSDTSFIPYYQKSNYGAALANFICFNSRLEDDDPDYYVPIKFKEWVRKHIFDFHKHIRRGSMKLFEPFIPDNFIREIENLNL